MWRDFADSGQMSDVDEAVNLFFLIVIFQILKNQNNPAKHNRRI